MIDLTQLGPALREAGYPAFRAKQVDEWLYRRWQQDPAAMTNLPAGLREWLSREVDLAPLRRVLVKESTQTTDKLLLRCGDGSLIETVLIRAPQAGVGQEESRQTICVSTQVGCAYGCKFCASGLAGFQRNLTAGEILAQFLQICHLEWERGHVQPGQRVPFDNLVVMGMGEPLANYDALMAALKVLNSPAGFNFGARRITVSTSGLVPEIRRLAEEPLGLRLAVSLHGATDAVRERIMPINRKYPLAELLPAIRAFAETRSKMVTLEFILIEEINDSLEQARALARIATDLHAHVNLIPYNRVPGLDWKRPNLQRQQTFAQVLRDARASVTLRREKGHDIEAACGQLRLQHEQAEGRIEPVPAKAR